MQLLTVAFFVGFLAAFEAKKPINRELLINIYILNAYSTDLPEDVRHALQFLFDVPPPRTNDASPIKHLTSLLRKHENLPKKFLGSLAVLSRDLLDQKELYLPANVRVALKELKVEATRQLYVPWEGLGPVRIPPAIEFYTHN